MTHSMCGAASLKVS